MRKGKWLLASSLEEVLCRSTLSQPHMFRRFRKQSVRCFREFRIQYPVLGEYGCHFDVSLPLVHVGICHFCLSLRPVSPMQRNHLRDFAFPFLRALLAWWSLPNPEVRVHLSSE